MTNPNLTVFAYEPNTAKKMTHPLYSKKSYSIIVTNPPQSSISDVQHILTNFEKYIGVIKSHTCLRTQTFDVYATYIRFKHWYDTPFTRKLHTELVIAYELGESLHTDYTIKMNIDGYPFELMLWKHTS
jgi:hypothetical protein